MDEEFQRMRERMHKITDTLQEHRLKIGEHDLRLDAAGAEILNLQDTMATSEQLESARAMLTVKLDHLADTIEPITRGIYWAVALILGGVLLALLGLVLRETRLS